MLSQVPSRALNRPRRPALAAFSAPFTARASVSAATGAVSAGAVATSAATITNTTGASCALAAPS
eukprot:1361154-Prymnesium_polylepis.1